METTMVEKTTEECLAEKIMIIESRYPNRDGFIRRIVHLWSSFFRINYINRKTGDIPESHFIQVAGNEVLEDVLEKKF